MESIARDLHSKKMQRNRTISRVSHVSTGRHAAGPLYITAAAVLWGSLGPLAKVAMDDGIAPITVAFSRAAMAALLFAVHARVTNTPQLRPRDYPWVLLFGVAGISLLYITYFMCVKTGGVALAAILLYTAPVWVAVGAWLWLGEPITRTLLASMAISMAGVVMVALAGGEGVRATAMAIGWGLLSGLAYALYYLLGRRIFSEYSAERVLSVALGIGALMLAPFVSVNDLRGASVDAWLAIVGLAIVPTYVAYLFYAAGLRQVEASRAAVIATLEPAVAVAISFLVWGDTLRPLAIVGAGAGGVCRFAHGAGVPLGKRYQPLIAVSGRVALKVVDAALTGNDSLQPSGSTGAIDVINP